eukprot:15764431-Heterocapsa_arctica.AAC.1
MPSSWPAWKLRSWQAWAASAYAGPARFGVVSEEAGPSRFGSAFTADEMRVRSPVPEFRAH